jgi:peptide/nickel transport system substrate-binding protein
VTSQPNDQNRNASNDANADDLLAAQLAAGESELTDELVQGSATTDDDSFEADDVEIDEALIAAWSRGDTSALYADMPAQRIGRRGFMVGLAAAGVPLAVLARIMNVGGSEEITQVNAPSFQQAAPPATPDATPATQETPVSSETPAASTPEAEEDVAVDPFGALTVVRTQTPQYTEAPAPSDTLRMMLTLNNNFDFSPVNYSQDFQIMASYLDPLVWIDERTMEPKPWLAESWSIDGENRRIIFTLREGITWHDGTPLSQEDVVFSLLTYRDDVDSAVRNFFVNVSDVKAVGSRSVAVEMSASDANFIANAGSQFIFPRADLAEHWESRPIGQRTLSDFDWEANPPVGTGPWIYDSRTTDSLTFKRNETYWGGDAPHFEKMVLTWDTDPRTRAEAWVAGETDVLFPIRQHELELVNTEPGLLYAADAPVVMFAQFNRNNPARSNATLFDDVRIRQALSMMIDRQKYASDIFMDFIDVNAAGTFPQPWLREPDQTNLSLSRRTARELLNEAGFSRQSNGTTLDPDGEPFSVNVITRLDARFEMRGALRMIADDFAQLGVTLRVEELGTEAFNERWIRGHDFDLIAFSYQTYAGFSDFDLYGSNWDIRINPQGWNPGGYSNSAVDNAIRDALSAPSLDDLVRSVHDLQVAANDDLFGLWLGFPQDLILVRPDVLGFTPVMNWQTWHTRKLWRRPEGAMIPPVVVR